TGTGLDEARFRAPVLALDRILSENMNIGPLTFRERPLFLAPMEDVSDPPFRILCKRYGADMLFTEFISSGGLVYDAEGSRQKLDIYEEERPVGIQIFGGDVEQVRQ